MTAYKGFVKLPTSSYKEWRKAVIGNAYDMDGSFGYQCYDLANEFWKNATGRYVVSATKDGGKKGCASGIWGARQQNNSGNEFILITDIKQLKKGDIVITNNSKCGHVCFMDEDYNSGKYLKVLGQNQGGSGGKLPKAKVNVIDWAFRPYFMGAFRYRKWHVEDKYTKGIYHCNYNMHIRKKPNGQPVKVKDCTSAMSSALTSKNPNADAIVKKGTNFTALAIEKSGDGYWAKNYSGYICIDDGKTQYCSKK